MAKVYTIHDIAIRLNISKSTVSRALRNHPDVSKETKQAVFDMAEKLNYQKNILASNLASKSTNLIGVVIPEIARQHFFAQALSGIQKVAKENGYIVMVCQSNEELQEEINQVRALVNSRVAGILISLSKETNSFGHLQEALDRNIPVVLFDRGTDQLEVSQITVDDYKGAFDITQHLIDQGYSNLAHLSGPMSLSISQKRYNGFIDALKNNGLNSAEAVVYQCDNLSLDAKEAVDRLLSMKKQPDAVFCMSDYMAIQVLKHLKDSGLKVPQDIAVAGFAGDPITELMEPQISTVEQPAFDIGVQAAKRLIMEVETEDKETLGFVNKVLPTKVISRSSTVK
ncbi:substrate-binding domain-containing protein [Flammeovirga yaeyamensis]|uniref:Substrate-binding domain-containing protein n=1 Tax=Flammeovirga yaeyamensis TaxID=367791 RepID=A0AAX1N9Y6_9BACT|nr:LacI family DNA-binding transcriptional regulator [Flammeovirga yaeyamensis]MBB3699326.1 LacI family transcriptional regulator [Flammeovirga yaeyamensis]NMF35412.1 LacI family transcriptional regulator [Flammeovirga yaeyamensis]QWG04272.1 substrate-binding domain-containing protein [Flammeovirga yaeyamensis]